DHTVNARIQDLFGDPLVHLAAIGWNAYEWRNRRCQAAIADDLTPIQHVLHAIAQSANVVRSVLHFEHHTVIGGVANCLRHADFSRRKSDEGLLALLQGANDRIQTRNINHFSGTDFHWGKSGHNFPREYPKLRDPFVRRHTFWPVEDDVLQARILGL